MRKIEAEIHFSSIYVSHLRCSFLSGSRLQRSQRSEWSEADTNSLAAVVFSILHVFPSESLIPCIPPPCIRPRIPPQVCSDGRAGPRLLEAHA
jgi:hypothetical protein